MKVHATSAPAVRRRAIFWATALLFPSAVVAASWADGPALTAADVASSTLYLVVPGLILTAGATLWASSVSKTTVALWEDTSSRTRWQLWQASTHDIAQPALIAGAIATAGVGLFFVIEIVRDGAHSLSGASTEIWLGVASVAIRPVAFVVLGVAVGRRWPRPWAPVASVAIAYGSLAVTLSPFYMTIRDQSAVSDVLASISALHPAMAFTPEPGVSGTWATALAMSSVLALTLAVGTLLPTSAVQRTTVAAATAGLLVGIVGLTVSGSDGDTWTRTPRADYQCRRSGTTQLDVCAAPGADHLLERVTDRVDELLSPVVPTLVGASVFITSDTSDQALSRAASQTIQSAVFGGCTTPNDERPATTEPAPGLLAVLISDRVVDDGAESIGGAAVSGSGGTTTIELVEAATSAELSRFVNNRAAEIADDCSQLNALIREDLT